MNEDVYSPHFKVRVETNRMTIPSAVVFRAEVFLAGRLIFEREYTNAFPSRDRPYAHDKDTAKEYAITAFTDKLKKVLS